MAGSDLRAARRYAQAVFELARESRSEDAWAHDLRQIELLFADPEARDALSSDRVPEEGKHQIIDAALADAQPGARNLARLLVEKGRLESAPSLLACFRDLVDQARGVVTARVTTAVALGDDEQDALRRRLEALTGKRVRLELGVDSEILGGLVVRIGDRLVDGSVRSRLLALKRSLAGEAA